MGNRMTARVITSYEDLSAIVGQDLGTTDWIQIDQDQVNLFGTAVKDLQWIHCDPERAERESPFGQTVVHGMLLLALLGNLRTLIKGVRFEIPARMGVFYGLNKVRFITPVKVGANIRLHLKVIEARLVEPKVIHVVYENTLEVEGQAKPALIAEALNRIYVA
jgi:acyl dehydratase